MNVRFLIDRLVQHQAVLLAEIATSGGARAPLAELSDQMFIHLALELERRGVGRKVGADMFGMALRAYLKKIQRLAESSTDRGTSLWEAVLAFVHESEGVSRARILERFCRDDQAQVRAVLFDLVESGLISVEGTGPSALFRPEGAGAARFSDPAKLAELLWLTIFREGPLERDELLRRIGRRGDVAEKALAKLVESGRVSEESVNGTRVYSSESFIVPPGQEAGWEAAVLDHYQSVVGTIIRVLRGMTKQEAQDPRNGGYTYTFDVWPGHPLEDEVYGVLGQHRERLSELRRRVDEANESLERPSEKREVVVYGGQQVVWERGDADGSH